MASGCRTSAILVALSIAVAGPAGAGEPAEQPGVSFDGNRIHIDAADQPLDRLLEVIGAREGFEVVNLRLDAAPGTVSGVASGPLGEILPWLLAEHSHVLVRRADPEDRAHNAAGIQRIILMGPSVKPASAPSPTSVSTPRPATPETDPPVSAGAEALREWLFGPDSTRSIRPDYTEDASAARDLNLTGVAGGSETLGAGKVLASALVDPGNVVIERAIDVSGDLPLSSHITVLATGGDMLQRTASNEWVPWDGSEASLIDNGIAVEGGQLRFAIDAGDLSEELFPVTFTLAYRTAQGLRYGVLQAVPDQAVLP